MCLVMLMEFFPRTATKGEIMKAYRNLAREWHPDAYDGDDQEMAEKMFLDLASAKEVLTDPGMLNTNVCSRSVEHSLACLNAHNLANFDISCTVVLVFRQLSALEYSFERDYFSLPICPTM